MVVVVWYFFYFMDGGLVLLCGVVWVGFLIRGDLVLVGLGGVLLIIVGEVGEVFDIGLIFVGVVVFFFFSGLNNCNFVVWCSLCSILGGMGLGCE